MDLVLVEMQTCMDVRFSFCKSVIFQQFGGKNLTVAGVFRKNIWFSTPVPKIKFDPPPQERIALVFIF